MQANQAGYLQEQVSALIEALQFRSKRAGIFALSCGILSRRKTASDIQYSHFESVHVSLDLVTRRILPQAIPKCPGSALRSLLRLSGFGDPELQTLAGIRRISGARRSVWVLAAGADKGGQANREDKDRDTPPLLMPSP